ncbi:MAG: hypothetical protein FD130_1459 [Halothiobacillaceae bacterium]|nr:MAG: hypothetical protein FD130_1459 [Halothiobacillaceae bacterium]
MAPTVWQSAEIGYCSNVHPTESFAALSQAIQHPINAVRVARGLSHMATGLWISAEAATEIVTQPHQQRLFTTLLAEANLDLITLNGFPYGDFHGTCVKASVYTPDWSDPRRYHYTCQLAQLLAQQLSLSANEGTLSTLPLGYRPSWSSDKQELALRHITQLALYLHRLKQETGRHIRVCFEMEPGCVLEQTQEALLFFRSQLPAVAQQQHIAETLLQAHLGICYDVCHQAVMFEQATESLGTLTAANITIGKIQLSSALHIERPDQAHALLARYAEPRYLHQVRSKTDANIVQGVMDLPEALAHNGLPSDAPWRIHFHIPIHATQLDDERLTTTQAEICAVFDFLAKNPEIRPHLEVETYTWQVLPLAFAINDEYDLTRGIHAELQWVEEQLQQRGLLA